MSKSKTTLPNTKARQRAQAKYNSKPEQIKRRAARNAARREMIKAGKARKGDGKDVAHKDGNPHNNDKSNLTMQSKSKNRSYPRTRNARKKNPRD
jgi:hypothetical protein